MLGSISGGLGIVTVILNMWAQFITFGSSFLYPILGQTLGTAAGGSWQTISSSLS